MQLLEDYISRSLPEDGGFCTRPGLLEKVDPQGRLLPYRGNTVVFLLAEPEKRTLAKLRERLYEAAGDMLAEPLDPDTFHMTLHDLVSGPAGSLGLEERMSGVLPNARAVLAQWRDQPPLHLKATWTFNMVNTSIVLGLAPADEDSGRRLDGMYAALEQVRTLGYDLTPHITLAYFRPGEYRQDQAARLREALGPVEWELTLRMEELVLQEFQDMNHYKTVP